MVKLDFLQAVKDLCENGRTFVLVIDSLSLEKKIISRAAAMSDYYLKLRSQDSVLEAGKLDIRIIKMMEVTKIGGADCWGHPPLKFEIKPGIGIQILPLMRVRI